MKSSGGILYLRLPHLVFPLTGELYPSPGFPRTSSAIGLSPSFLLPFMQNALSSRVLMTGWFTAHPLPLHLLYLSVLMFTHHHFCFETWLP